ncbi:phosphoribosylamine--glycine ligase [Candidatus Pacearchaeota archaeon]|nr:phosphoribosylamine--glycine ligase [Candidatus Pacearchaeota archaeon]
MEKILIVGNGGREDALGWHLSKSNEVSKVIRISQKENFNSVEELIIREKIGLTIIGSEGQLSSGIVDFLNSKGIHNVFGPTQKMALVESDKFYSYDLMRELSIPQARSIKCSTKFEVFDAVKKFEQPVLKYRGLAGGKGVKVYSSQKEAWSDLENFVKNFGTEILVAERLHGKEFSVFGIADGRNVLPFEAAFQDYKRLGDGDAGPNTGGMGSYGPVQFISKELIYEITDGIIAPVVRKTNYKGFIYAGMIMSNDGVKVIEFNSRLGDPETQPTVMLIKNNLYDSIKSSLEGNVQKSLVKFKKGSSCCVVLASRGYPENYEVGLPISGISEAEKIKGIKIFHAGTKFENNSWMTDGGRVLGVTSYSCDGISIARKLAYEAVLKINVPGGFHYRKDISLIV